MNVVVVDNSADSNARSIVGENRRASTFSGALHCRAETGCGDCPQCRGRRRAWCVHRLSLMTTRRPPPGWLAVMVACARKSGARSLFRGRSRRARRRGRRSGRSRPIFPAAGACLTVRILPTVPPISAPTTPCSRVRRWLRARGRSTRASTDPAVKTACSCSKSFRAEGGSPGVRKAT